MRSLLIIMLSVLLLGCNSHRENSKADTSLKQENVSPNKEQELEGNKWNWNEKLTPPKKSEINNFKYTAKLLFKSWTLSDGDKSKPAFTLDETAFKTDSSEFKYTINNDSIRIFTNYEYGDGVDRGIIVKLTVDSLIINWSTGDINKYVSTK